MVQPEWAAHGFCIKDQVKGVQIDETSTLSGDVSIQKIGNSQTLLFFDETSIAFTMFSSPCSIFSCCHAGRLRNTKLSRLGIQSNR